MGAMQNNPETRGKGSKKRGSVRNDHRLDAFTKGAAVGSADWGGVDSKWIQAVVVSITLMGGAVTFGLSRDQGAHSLTLMLEGNRKTLWFNGNAVLGDELSAVVATLEAMD